MLLHKQRQRSGAAVLGSPAAKAIEFAAVLKALSILDFAGRSRLATGLLTNSKL
jgi:hypothetical protein